MCSKLTILHTLNCRGNAASQPSLQCVIQQHLAKEATELEEISSKLTAHITDIFSALGNYDVRFDFDPFSIEDCRCHIVSTREISVLCSLKHVPLSSLVIEQDVFPGRVKLKLKKDFADV